MECHEGVHVDLNQSLSCHVGGPTGAVPARCRAAHVFTGGLAVIFFRSLLNRELFSWSERSVVVPVHRDAPQLGHPKLTKNH